MFNNAFFHHDLPGMSCRVGATDRGTIFVELFIFSREVRRSFLKGNFGFMQQL